MLLEIDIPEVTAEKLHLKISKLEDPKVHTMSLAVSLIKFLPNRFEEFVHDMRMGLASDDTDLATDSVLGLWFWLKISLNFDKNLPHPPIDLIREIGVIVATRRRATLEKSLQLANWVFENGTDEHRKEIGQLVAQGLGYLFQELSYQENHDSDNDVPLLRWACTHLSISMSIHGFTDDEAIKAWLNNSEVDPLPEIRNVNLPTDQLIEKSRSNLNS